MPYRSRWPRSVMESETGTCTTGALKKRGNIFKGSSAPTIGRRLGLWARRWNSRANDRPPLTGVLASKEEVTRYEGRGTKDEFGRSAPRIRTSYLVPRPLSQYR